MKKIITSLLVIAMILTSSVLPGIQIVNAAEVTYSPNDSSTNPAFIIASSNGTVHKYDQPEALSYVLNKVAVSGDVITLKKNATLTQNTEIKKGVTLFLPASASDTNYSQYIRNSDNVTVNAETAGAKTAYTTLTLEHNTVLTVHGNVFINGNTTQVGSTHCVINGSYSKIDTKEGSKINVYGTLDNFGIISGKGTLEAFDGSKVYDVFVIYHFRGGTHTVSGLGGMFGLTGIEDVPFSFNEFSMANIQITTTFNYGATLYGSVKAYASSQYNCSTVSMIGTSDSFYVIPRGAKIVKSVTPSSELNNSATMSKIKYDFYGGGTFSSDNLEFLGHPLTTSHFILPIPGNVTISLNSGNYYMDYAHKFMPGAKLIIEEDAVFTNADQGFDDPDISKGKFFISQGTTGKKDSNAILIFYEDPNFDSGMGAYAYTSGITPAQMIVRGRFENKGLVAGQIITENNGKVIIPCNHFNDSKYVIDSSYSSVITNECDKMLNDIYSVPTYKKITNTIYWDSVNYTISHSFSNIKDNGNGTHTGTCNDCKITTTEAHDYAYTINADGHTARCTKCNNTTIESHEILENRWEVVVEPNCTETGLRQNKCTKCGESVEEVMKALGHDYVITNRTEATYFAAGNIHYECQRSGCDSTKDEVIPILVDTIAPTVSITVKNTTTNKIITPISFIYVKDESVSVTIDATDEQTDIRSVQYYISDKELTQSQITSLTSGWKTYSNPFTITTEGKYVVYVKVIDKANTYVPSQSDNITYISSNGMIIDRTAPVISFTDNKIVDCHKVEFAVSDTNLDTVTIKKNGTTVNIIPSNNKYILTDDGTYTVTATDKAGYETVINNIIVGHDWESTMTIDKEATYFEAGSKSYHCTRCDEKKDVTVIPILVDKTAPSVSITVLDESFTTSSPVTYSYVTDGQLSVKIEAEDKETGLRSLQYYISNRELSNAELQGIQWNSCQSGHVMTLKDDGRYIIYARAIDNANTYVSSQVNNMTTVNSKGYILDSKLPDIKFTNNVTVDCYKVEFTVTDTNLDKVTIMKDNTVVDVTSVGNKYTLTEAGNYTITASDKAGLSTTISNIEVGHKWDSEWTIDVDPTYTTKGSKSHHCLRDGCLVKNDITEIDYVVDNQLPVIRFEVKDKSNNVLNINSDVNYLSEEVELTFTVEDNQTGLNSILYYISDRVLSEEELNTVNWINAANVNGENSHTRTFTLDERAWIIYVKAEDLAGNYSATANNSYESNSKLIIVDLTAPKVEGIESDTAYCPDVEISVNDTYLDKVKVNDQFITLSDGKYVLTTGTYTIIVTDKAGNVTIIENVVVGHDMKHVERVEATCLHKGNVEYWHCERCNINFNDSLGNEVITDIVIDIDKNNHDESTIIYIDRREPTCTESGVTGVKHCTNCNLDLDSSHDMDPLGHDFTYRVQKDSTCKETGYITHYHCERCELNFETDNKYNKVSIEDVVIAIDPNNHVDTELRWYEENGYISIGYSGDTYCNDCLQYIAYGYELDCIPDELEPIISVNINGKSLSDNNSSVVSNTKLLVNIIADDEETGIRYVKYYVSDKVLSNDELAKVEWNGYFTSFELENDNIYVIYVKASDKANSYRYDYEDNVSYFNTGILTIDSINPVISGVNAYTGYCDETEFTVEDDNLDKVLVNEQVVALTNNKYTLTEGTYTIKAIDKAGNMTVVENVTIGHDWDDQWSVSKYPSFTETGTKFHACLRDNCTEMNDVTDIPVLVIEGIENVDYTGYAITQDIVIKNENIVLEEGKDYTLEYSNNVNAGEATVTISLIGNYNGSTEKTFTIFKGNMADSAIIGLDDIVYSGNPITHRLVIINGDNLLVKDVDYTLEYSNNVNVGEASVTISGKGNYEGEVTETFNILPKSIHMTIIDNIKSKDYTGEAVTQDVIVKDGDKVLEEGKDYKVEYENNILPGNDALVKVTGINNYIDSYEETFRIKELAYSVSYTFSLRRASINTNVSTNNNTLGAGDEVTYYITVTTDEDSATANNVTITNLVPKGLRLVNDSISHNGTVNGESINWNLDTIAPGSSVTVSFTVVAPEVKQDVVWENIASINIDDVEEKSILSLTQNIDEKVNDNVVITPESKEEAVVVTGDNSNAALWVTLSMISIGLLFIINKKKTY